MIDNTKELHELVTRIQSGKTDLYTQLFIKLDRFLGYYADRYYRQWSNLYISRGITRDDLKQQYAFAVYAAVRLYNGDKGNFVTLLAYCIKNQNRAILGGVHEPLSNTSSKNDENELEAWETAQDIKAEEDFERAEDKVFKEYLNRSVRDSVCSLPANRKEVIEKLYFDGISAKELSEQLGVCPQRIGQLKRDAFRKLRADMKIQELYAYCWGIAYTGSLKSFKNNTASSQESFLERKEYIDSLRQQLNGEFNDTIMRAGSFNIL